MTWCCKALYIIIIFKIFLFDHFQILYWICYNIASVLCFGIFFFFFFFWLWGMWDLSSLTRNQTHTSWALGGEFRGPNLRTPREVPLFIIIYFKICVLIKESQLIHSRITPSVWFLKYIRSDMLISLPTPNGIFCLQAVGCDRQLGSNAKEDNCGVCAGDGATCRLVRGQSKSHVSPEKSRF